MKKEVCSTQDYLVSGETFSIRWDESKGYASTHPQPAADKLGSYYESAAYLSHNESQQSVVGLLYRMARKYMFRIKHKMFKKRLPANSSILDYGCGTGGFLEYTSSKAYASFGVETNTYARDQAIRKGLTVVSSWEQLPQEKFNLISLWHVLEHVSDLDQCIQEIQKRLNTNDILLIAVPNLNAFDAIYYAEFWAAYDVPIHFWHFSKNAIKLLFEKEQMVLKTVLPMKFDSFYVSLLSEKYKRKSMNPIRAFFIGLRSNLKARRSGDYSSLIYVIKNKK